MQNDKRLRRMLFIPFSALLFQLYKTNYVLFGLMAFVLAAIVHFSDIAGNRPAFHEHISRG